MIEICLFNSIFYSVRKTLRGKGIYWCFCEIEEVIVKKKYMFLGAVTFAKLVNSLHNVQGFRVNGCDK